MLFRKNKTDYGRLTKYDFVKTVKRDNFTHLNKTAALKGQTVLFGDSITEIFNWYELFYDFSRESGQAVYNRGISGDTSDRLLERLWDNALNIEPRNIVILIGTNDIGLGIPNEITAGNIDKILSEIKEKSPKTNIILQAVYPVNKNMNVNSVPMVGRRKNETVRELNEALAVIARKHNVKWLDITDKLSNAGGKLSESYCYDGLHLNVYGFETAAEAIIPLLEY